MATATLLGIDAAPESQATRVFAASQAATANVSSYTADLHVFVRLKSFPYLGFREIGHIAYARPNIFSIHFDHVPWFAKGFDDIKLDALEPTLWPQTFTIVKLEPSANASTTVTMLDPKSPNVTNVVAVLDRSGVRSIVWSYTNGGRIELRLAPGNYEGYPLPASEDADIAVPFYHMTAHADFFGYHVTTATSPSPKPTAGGSV